MTNCAFPMLESLSLTFFSHTPSIPATFLRGQIISSPSSTTSYSEIHYSHIHFRLLLSATASPTSHWQSIHPSPNTRTSLLACLQVMPCLLSLDLTYSPAHPYRLGHPSESFTPEDTILICSPKEVVTHSKLKRFHFVGDDRILKASLVGLEPISRAS